MDLHSDIDRLSRLLMHRRRVLDGHTSASLELAVRRGEFFRVARGWYARAEAWEALTARDRQLLRVLTVQSGSASAPVYSHGTAATLLSLPVYRFDDRQVHTLVPAQSTTRSTGIVLRHRGPFSERDLQRSAGLIHTGIVRTAVDVARTMSFESGLVTVEGAMRRLSQQSRATDEELRAMLLGCLAQLPRSRGCVRAGRVLRFGGGLSESPLESLARLQLERLGFAVRQQVPVSGPNGETYRMDLELVGLRVFVEVDGRQKYLDEKMRGGRTAEQVVLREKAREDWVRGTQDYRVIRAGWEHSTSLEAMAARMRAFGIAPPGLPHERQLVNLY